jgi:recombination protein RecT
VRRTGQVSVIEAHEVCENDQFEFEYGLNSKLIHKPCIKGERGNAYCYYAFAKMKDDSYAFMVMSTQDINKIRDKYSKTKDFGPWKTEYDAMAKKTVLKQLIKYLPLSTEVMNQLVQDETTKTEIKADMTESLDIEYMSSDHLEDNHIDVDYTDVKSEAEAEPKEEKPEQQKLA